MTNDNVCCGKCKCGSVLSTYCSCCNHLKAIHKAYPAWVAHCINAIEHQLSEPHSVAHTHYDEVAEHFFLNEHYDVEKVGNEWAVKGLPSLRGAI